MNSIAPQEVWRSEAFAEDLLDEQQRRQGAAHPRLSTALLCAVPVVVALLGGVVAFFHAMG